MPARDDRKRSKAEALAEDGTLNPAPDKVGDPKFQEGGFFDPRDVLQVKYEMLRRVSVEKASITDVSGQYGVSRPTFYQAKADFDEAGIAGLVPRKRGPHGPHKIQSDVLAFLIAQLSPGEPIRARELVNLVQKQFGATTIFQPLTTSTAIRTLNNPRYAGVYAYGRRHYRRASDGKKVLRKRECNDWLACIPNAHPGYITWEQFQQNLKTLKTNGRGYEVARASPPREGTALPQGRAVCGCCGRYLRVRYAARRERLEAWYVCDRAHGSRGEPNCQSIAGAPVDEAIGELISAKMTPAAVELALEIRKEIELRHEEADRLRLRAVERAQIEADLAQRRFMLVDPGNRLVADTLECEWNDKLRALANAQEERQRGQREDQCAIDDAIRDRLIAMTTDFKTLWRDPSLPNRERKRLLAYVIEDVTLIKSPAAGTTTLHVRFKGGKTETLTTHNPKSSAQQVKTQPKVVELVDKLLDDHIYSEIADILNEKGIRPGGSARRGQADAQFTDLRVAYLALQYGLRSRYDRLRDRGMLTKAETASRLGIHETTLTRWVAHGLVARHAHNGHAYLYEAPGPNPPVKHSSRWDPLIDRTAIGQTMESKSSYQTEGAAV